MELPDRDIAFQQVRDRLSEYGQRHVLAFWDELDQTGQDRLLADICKVDFPLLRKLIDQWIRTEPEPETFGEIRPIDVAPIPDPADARAAEAKDAGEQALRDGRVGVLMVAGGQGSRLGFDGPKGAFPIGPISQKTLFGYHAEKIRNLNSRYGCVLPWYVMVSAANHEATESFFRKNDYFGLDKRDVLFFEQAMMPCVDCDGKFMLAARDRLAMNPNGHGGCLPAMVDGGVIRDARGRGFDVITYFQVDNWAVHVADPYFIGYHVLRHAAMSSKIIRKNHPREGVGVHCLCDGEYRVIEYTELDIYPQLLETDETGRLRFYAGNPAVHTISVDFVETVSARFDTFPWHRAYKKIAHIDSTGRLIRPDTPNGYKFETFIFDALRFIDHEPVALELDRAVEFTPVKQSTGTDSVESATRLMAELWADWLDAAGSIVPRDQNGRPTVRLDISPEFAITKEEFIEKSAGRIWPTDTDLCIGPTGDTVFVILQ
ncbi:MAG: UDPGP type 1 family protein [Candidatus Hydrogenedentes bacterium]|nr:UDPGP type 1 family protein [Candidatus Hydrogenedentota bacterium]